jgi:hypothetical protein
MYSVGESYSMNYSQILAKSFTQKKPKAALQRGKPLSMYPAFNTPEFDRIRAFKAYMDSLARSPTGRKLYDSINAARPHLVDSIAIVSQVINNK